MGLVALSRKNAFENGPLITGRIHGARLQFFFFYCFYCVRERNWRKKCAERPTIDDFGTALTGAQRQSANDGTTLATI